MRILAVANHLGSRGGLERTQLANGQGLAARGHRIDLVHVSAGDLADAWAVLASSVTAVAGTLPRRKAPVTSTASLVAAVRAGVRARPEVVYAYRYLDLPYAVAVARLAGAAVVHHLCLPPPTRIPRWLRPALAAVDVTLSVSADTAARWQGTGLRASTVTVVPTSVDTGRYRPGTEDGRRATRVALGLEDDDVLVVYAGRLAPEKGVGTLVQAVRRLSGDGGRRRLVVAGGAAPGTGDADALGHAAELRDQAADVPVTWLGHRSDVVPLLQAADVAVVPSHWPEPLARGVLEPLACGVPVVATAVGGTPEILTGWLAELLVPPGDAVALAERLRDVGGWRQHRPDLGARCRRHAEDRLSADDELDLIERAMVRAAGARGRRQPSSHSAST